MGTVNAASKTEVSVKEQFTAWPGYPAAIRGGGFVFVSGVRGGRPGYVPTSYADFPAGPANCAQGYSLVDSIEGTVAADAWAAHDNLSRVLAAAGTSDDQILLQRMWQRDKRFFPVYERVRKHWQPDAAPSSGLGVSAVGGNFGRWIGIEGVAVDSQDPNRLGDRETLTPPNDPKNPSASIYALAVGSGPFVFLAGQISIKTAEPGKPQVNSFDDIPEEGRFLATGRSHPDSRDGPIAAQTWYIYNEIRRTLENSGLAFEDIVHVRVYLSDHRDFATFHRVHEHLFGKAAPALSVIQFAEVGHKGGRIEIEPVALRRGPAIRESIAWPCPAPMSGPAAVRAGPLLMIAGMLGLAADGNPASDPAGVDPDAQGFIRSLQDKASSPALPAQVWWAWRRIQQVCEAAGTGIEALAKTVVYLREESDLAVYEAVRSMFIRDHLPAFDCLIVPNPGPTPDIDVQIDVTALM